MKENRKQKTAIFLFVGTICFFFFGSLLMPDRGRSALEARKLTRHIDYTSPEQYLNRDLFQNIEDYVSDQMIGRDTIQGLYADIQRLTGHRNINHRILLKNDHIVEIYQNYPDTLPYAEKIAGISDTYKEAGIPFLFVNTPVKASIVAGDETWVGNPISNRRTIVEQFFEELSGRGVNTLDLTETLQEVYDGGTDPFYKTDHHWNEKGVYACYKVLIHELNKNGMDLPVSGDSAFKTYTDPHDFFGSGVRTRGGTVLFSGHHDTVRVRYPSEGEFTLQREGKKPLHGDGKIFIDKKIYKKNTDRYFDYYNINLGGNSRKILISNDSLPEGKKLVMAGDSFSIALLPMLSSSFKEIHYFDARLLNVSITEYAEQIGADQVVFLFNANMEGNRYAHLQ